MKQQLEQDELPVFSTEEFLAMSRSLERHHQIFHQFWQIGKPTFTREIKTAAVSMEKGCVKMFINPEFWASQTEHQKEFVICHETLHPLLKHGIRGADIPNSQNKLANKAMDVCVNHALINRFGFNRELVDPENKYCWTDTVFPDQKISDNKSFEYYFNKLTEDTDDSDEGGGGETVDNHDGLGSLDDFDFDKFRENVAGSMSEEEAKEVRDFFGEQDKADQKGQEEREGSPAKAGDGAGNWFNIWLPKLVPQKRKWETVISKWTKYRVISTESDHWARRPRRIESFGGNFYLPSQMETEVFKADMVEVYFFLDTSGSCINFAPRFFKAARSLPKDRFHSRLFCFDTMVKETDLLSERVYGGGGTRFDIIEKHIQKTMTEENVAYPKAVFIISDGAGNKVDPERPGVWHWFLTSTSYTHLIPAGCHIYDLNDFS